MADSQYSPLGYDELSWLMRKLAEVWAEAKEDPLGAAYRYAKGAARGSLDTVAGMAEAELPLVGRTVGAAIRRVADTSTDRRDPSGSVLPGMDPSFAETIGETFGVPSPGNAQPAVRNILRPGGKKGLIPSHATGIYQVGDVEKLPQEFTSPSIGISKGHLNPHFEDQDAISLQFIPRSGSFDPRHSTTTLFNRDAYTPRGNQYIERTIDPENVEGRAAARLLDRGLVPPPGAPLRSHSYPHGDASRLKEFTAGGPGGGHQLAILRSPVFRSFEQYENSPKGARLLTGTPESDAPWTKGHELDKLLDINSYVDRSFPEGFTYHTLLADARSGSKPARNLLRLAEQVPSHYAELKAHGPVQMGPENWAGVLVRPGRSWEQFANRDTGMELDWLAERLQQKYRIPARVDRGNSFDAGALAEAMQEAAGPARKLTPVDWVKSHGPVEMPLPQPTKIVSQGALPVHPAKPTGPPTPEAAGWSASVNNPNLWHGESGHSLEWDAPNAVWTMTDPKGGTQVFPSTAFKAPKTVIGVKPPPKPDAGPAFGTHPEAMGWTPHKSSPNIWTMAPDMGSDGAVLKWAPEQNKWAVIQEDGTVQMYEANLFTPPATPGTAPTVATKGPGGHPTAVGWEPMKMPNTWSLPTSEILQWMPEMKKYVVFLPDGSMKILEKGFFDAP